MRGFHFTLPVMVLLCVAMPLRAESLSSVLGYALPNSPDVLEVRNQRDAIAAELTQAEAGYLPTVDLNAGYGYEYTDSPSTRPKDDEELHRGEFGLTLRQKLFDGSATEAEVERQTARLETADYLLEAALNDTALAVSEQYLNLLRYRNVLELAEENHRVHKRIQDQIRLRSEAGVGRGADFDQINARVALVDSNLIAARVNLQDAETGFKRVIGREAPESMDPAPDVADQLPASFEEALVLAEAGNDTFLSSATDVMEAQAQHKASRANLFPKLDFELSANANNDLDGTDGYDNDVSAMVRLRYNLFDGGADRALVASTASKINEAQEVRNRSRRQVEETLRLAWAAYQATSRQINIIKQQIAFSEATRDAYAKQFNIGQRTLLDLLNTENELFQARESLVVAKTDQLFAQYRIFAVMGRMLEAAEVQLDELQRTELQQAELQQASGSN